MDDVPVGLYATEKDAKKAAETMPIKTAYNTARRLKLDCSTPVCFGYTVFKNGSATELVIVDREDDA